MALFRRFSVLLTTLLLAATGGLAADQPLNLETVIAKARGAAAVDQRRRAASKATSLPREAGCTVSAATLLCTTRRSEHQRTERSRWPQSDTRRQGAS